MHELMYILASIHFDHTAPAFSQLFDETFSVCMLFFFPLQSRRQRVVLRARCDPVAARDDSDGDDALNMQIGYTKGHNDGVLNFE